MKMSDTLKQVIQEMKNEETFTFPKAREQQLKLLDALDQSIESSMQEIGFLNGSVHFLNDQQSDMLQNFYGKWITVNIMDDVERLMVGMIDYENFISTIRDKFERTIVTDHNYQGDVFEFLVNNHILTQDSFDIEHGEHISMVAKVYLKTK